MERNCLYGNHAVLTHSLIKTEPYSKGKGNKEFFSNRNGDSKSILFCLSIVEKFRHHIFPELRRKRGLLNHYFHLKKIFVKKNCCDTWSKLYSVTLINFTKSEKAL